MSRWVLLLAACASPPAREPAPPPAAPALLTIRADAIGPLTAKTPATLVGLRAALRGFDVAPLQSDGVEYRVSQDGTRLFDVVPDAAGRILNVHVISPKIDVAGRPWRVGATFPGDAPTCECWSDQTVCFREGEHVAVALAKLCREGSARGDKTPIRAVIWSARPLSPGGYDDP